MGRRTPQGGSGRTGRNQVHLITTTAGEQPQRIATAINRGANMKLHEWML